MKLRQNLFILLLSLATTGVQAQKAWTLQECIDYALEHNIQIQKNKVSEQTGEVALYRNKGSLFPSLSFSTSQNVGYRPYAQTVNMVQGDIVTSTTGNVTYSGSYGVSANVTLWNGGINYKNIEAQKLQNEITKLTTEQSELTIQEQIAQLYVQIMYTKEAVNVNKQLLQTAQSQYDRGAEMVQQGQMSKADLAQLNAQLSSAQYDLTNSNTQVANFKRQLKSLLELDLETSFDVAGETPTDEQVMALIPNAQDTYNKALTNRPEIKSAELGIEAANLSLNIARRGYLPTIGASASINTNHTSGNDATWGNQVKSNLNMGAGINISVPILDRRVNSSNVRNAKLQQVNSQLNLADKKNNLSSTIEQYWLNAYTNQQNYMAAKARVKSTEASYELLNEQFQNGLKNTVDVLQGRDNVISAEQTLLQTKYNTLLNTQLLRFYAGEKFGL